METYVLLIGDQIGHGLKTVLVKQDEFKEGHENEYFAQGTEVIEVVGEIAISGDRVDMLDAVYKSE